MLYLHLFLLALCSVYSSSFAESRVDKGDYFLVCRGALELGVIFDVSRSIPKRDFGPVKKALTKFLSQFTIGPKALRVAFIPFENEIHPMYGFTLDQYNTSTQVTEHIEGIPLIGSMLNRRIALTETYKALKYTREVMLSSAVTREGIPRVCLVMTDGNSQKRRRTQEEAKFLRESGVDVYAVGFGTGIGMRELKIIAGDESRVKLVRNLKNLESGMADLSVKVCEKVPKPKEHPCKKRDIVFAFSPAELGKILSRKTVDLLEELNQQTVGTNDYTFGVASGVCPEDQGFALGADLTSSLKHYRQSHITAIVKGLKMSSPFTGQGKGECNTAVLVVNKKSLDNLQTNIENLRHAGAEEVIVWNVSGAPVNVKYAKVINGAANADISKTAQIIATTLNAED